MSVGVCGVSKWCLGHSELCLGYINAKSIEKGPLGIIISMCRLSSQWPIFSEKWQTRPDFQRGVGGHFPAFLMIFFGLYSQVMDLET